MSHKRTLTEADIPEHEAKVAAVEADLPDGRAPPSLAAQLASVTAYDIFKHEDAWKNEAAELRVVQRQLRALIKFAGVLKLTLAEQKAYGVGPLSRGAKIDGSRQLIHVDDDNNDALLEFECDKCFIDCACCDFKNTQCNGLMWANQEWRILGTRHHLCGSCRARIEAGEELEVIRDEHKHEMQCSD